MELKWHLLRGLNANLLAEKRWKKKTAPMSIRSEVKSKSFSCVLTLWDPMHYTVHGFPQARILEWLAAPFSRGSSLPRDWTQVSHNAAWFFPRWATKEAQIKQNLPCWAVLGCSVVSDSLRPHGLYSPWDSPGKNSGVGSHALLQGIFPARGSNPGLLHCRSTLYHLSHQGSLSISRGVLK